MAKKRTYKLKDKVYARAKKQGRIYLMRGEITSHRKIGTEDEHYIVTDKHGDEYKIKYEDLYKTYDEMIDDERNYL